MAESMPGKRRARDNFSLGALLRNAVLVILLATIAFQVARLFWALLTPQGPIGQPHAAVQTLRGHDQANWAIDPFFRNAPALQQASSVTSLSLKLFGTRQNSASGLGSAIIAAPDGIQSSYGVGETIVPGAKLYAVAFDHVTIDHNGVKEMLYIDQSVPAPVAAPTNTVPIVTLARPLATSTPPLVPASPAGAPAKPANQQEAN